MRSLGLEDKVLLPRSPKARILLASFALLASIIVSGCSRSYTGSRPIAEATGDPAVTALVAGVKSNQAELKSDLERLTGVTAAPVGGRTVRLRTRHARSGAPVKAAQAYVRGVLRTFGLDSVGYQKYGASPAARNVVGEIRGSTRPNEIVVIGAHLDDMPAVGRAPGADDNAASCVALLYIARHLAGVDMARTVRFVFFGGEEIGSLGSRFAAKASRRAHEDIIGVLNADAIGWNGSGSRVVEVHRRRLSAAASARGDRRIANAFVRAIRDHGITDIRARVMADGLAYSDHNSYWLAGYGAAWVYEDSRSGNNPTRHTSGDTLDTLKWGYYVSVTQALLATCADLGRLLPQASSTTLYRRYPMTSRSRAAATLGDGTVSSTSALDPPSAQLVATCRPVRRLSDGARLFVR